MVVLNTGLFKMNHFHRALQGMSLGKSKPYFSKGYVSICFEIYFNYIVENRMEGA